MVDIKSVFTYNKFIYFALEMKMQNLCEIRKRNCKRQIIKFKSSKNMQQTVCFFLSYTFANEFKKKTTTPTDEHTKS